MVYTVGVFYVSTNEHFTALFHDLSLVNAFCDSFKGHEDEAFVEFIRKENY